MATYQSNYDNAVNGMSGLSSRYNDEMASWRADVDAVDAENVAKIASSKAQGQMSELSGDLTDIGILASVKPFQATYSKYIFKQGKQPLGALDEAEHGGYDFKKSSVFGKKYWKKRGLTSNSTATEGADADEGLVSKVRGVADDISKLKSAPSGVRTVAGGVRDAVDTLKPPKKKPTATPEAQEDDAVQASGEGSTTTTTTADAGVPEPLAQDDGTGTGLGRDIEMTDRYTGGLDAQTRSILPDIDQTGVRPEPRSYADYAIDRHGGGSSRPPQTDFEDTLPVSHGGTIAQPRPIETTTPTTASSAGDREGTTVTSSADTAGEGGGTFNLTALPEETADIVKTGAGDADAVAKFASDTAKAVAKSTATALGEGGADEALGEGLDVAGTALEATGVFAWLGALLQVGGTVAEGYGAYALTKSIVDEATGNVSDPDPNLVDAPKKPKTQAQLGGSLSIIPDTAMSQPSFSGSW